MSHGAEFDRYAGNYDALLQQAISVSGEDKNYFARGRVAWFARRLREAGCTPRSILDYGCGTGSATPFFKELLRVKTVLGVDVSPDSLEIARQTCGSEATRFELVERCHPSGTIDLAFCNGVFHHIPVEERAGAVEFVYRSLAPGGLFAFWENNPWNPGTRFVMSRCPFDDDAVTLSPPGSRRLLRAGGFEILRTDYLFIFPKFLSPLRALEPPLARLPFGTQYMVLCRKG
jgi:SAM-dependent methyltransferase